MPGPLACIWKAPFTSVTVLDVPSWANLSFANNISDDGNTVVGWAADHYPTGSDYGQRHRAVRWTNTHITQVATDMGSDATYCSTGGSLVVVSSQTTNMRVWPSVGVEHVLNPPIGYDSSAAAVAGYRGVDRVLAFRTCSDNGTVVLGNVLQGSTGFACRWDSEVPTVLPNAAGFVYGQAYCCSADGSIVFGGLNPSSGGLAAGAYWVGTTCHVLTQPPASTMHYDGALCNANGSAVWGLAYDDAVGARPTYWDNLSSSSGGLYGTYHIMNRLPGTYLDDCTVVYCADNPTAMISVGQDTLGSGSPRYPVRWHGITLTVLSESGYNSSQPTACSPDGSIVTGWTYNSTSGDTYPCFWDAGGTQHILPTIANPDDGFKGKAYGISRDGSTIYGIIDTPDAPDVTETTLTTSELLFSDTPGFVDLANPTLRRMFIATGGTPAWVGAHGALPFGAPPSVYLTTLGPPLDFAGNNGTGGGFAPSGAVDPAGGPGCTPYYVTESAGPASRPEWRLSVSDDGSRTWSRLVKPREIGVMGHYKTRLRWLKMGHFRQRSIKLECTDPVRRNIIGIYVDDSQGMT